MRGETVVANSLLSSVRSAGSTMRGIYECDARLMRAQNLANVERERLPVLASRMTALWAAILLEHFPRLESQFWQGLRALVHGQLHLEHVHKIEQGYQGSSRAEAVFCHFPLPVA